jgi:cytochrome c peroxidase
MHQQWVDAVEKLEADTAYPDLFLKAFGICEIDSMHVAMAIAQFERTMISGNSKFDKRLRGELELTPSETNGLLLFNQDKIEATGQRGADCFHCHGAQGGMFTDNDFHNNGLDSVFTDFGRELTTGDINDRGKFRSPTLRNIELTAPYMHDGRFATLEEVIEHYNMGGHASPTLDPLMKNVGIGLELTQEEKTDLINFLKTLTDMDFVNNPEFSEPQ